MIGFDLDPYVPDGNEAREQAERELQNPRYADAKPTWFDYLAEDVAEFINGLFSPDTGEQVGGVALIIVTIVVVAALVTVLLLWGRPRASRRMRRSSDLLGEKDDRTAAQLRADAERRARDGQWDAATVLRFRAVARSLLERDIVDPAPGATAQAIAREAAAAFEAHRAELTAAASAFDEVRYLRHPASAETYRVLVDTDDLITRAQPASESRAVPA